MESDISWISMIHDLSANVLSFRINAIANSLPSPSNLHRWGIKSEGKCYLCRKHSATAQHILSACYFSLKHHRYTWRHNNVLVSFHKDFIEIVRSSIRFNAKRVRSQRDVVRFVKKGANAHRRHKVFKSILCIGGALDWKIVFDFHNNPTIPIESNVDTLCRPDVVIYSASKKIIIWFELTVPLERNCFAASQRKLRVIPN